MTEESNFRNTLDQLMGSVLTQNDLASYAKLIDFIDANLAEAFKLSGDDRSAHLVRCLLSVRSFLNSEIITENSRKILLANANAILDEIYKIPEDTKDDVEEEKK